MALSLVMQPQATAFIRYHPSPDRSSVPSSFEITSLLLVTPNNNHHSHLNNNGGGGHEEQDDNDDDDDAEFYRDLQRAKLQKLGGSIPPEQAKRAAAQAEGDFLRAMRDTKDEFQKAKEELGSDGAVDLFLDRIREEEENEKDE